MLQEMMCSRLEVYSRMLCRLMFYAQSVLYLPDDFTGCIEFALWVCYDVVSYCY